MRTLLSFLCEYHPFNSKIYFRFFFPSEMAFISLREYFLDTLNFLSFYSKMTK